MVFVIYVAPNYTETATYFVATISGLKDVNLALISQEPVEWLPLEIRNRLVDFELVQSAFDPAELELAVRSLIRRQEKPHRLIAAVEQIQVPLARVRESLGIEGMSVETAMNFRDKDRMKNLFEIGKIPCARHRKAKNEAEIFSFAEETGFPLVLKPLDGAASQATFKVNDRSELSTIVASDAFKPGQEIQMEEFILGTEHSFDTFSLNGQPVFHSLTHYYPNPLEVIREPWIQWQVVLPREVESEIYDDIRDIGFKTLQILGMHTGMSHMEWFRRPDGSIAVSEVAARPPGAQITTLINRANDCDSVAAWAKLLIFGEFETPVRKYASGAAYLRGMGSGKVRQVVGLENLDPFVKGLITDYKIPALGMDKSKSYEGEGYLIVRHPETFVVKEALTHIVSTVRVQLG